MGRYHNEFKFPHPIHQELFADIHSYMMTQGYEYINFEGEDVYKKGKGIATGPTFIKIMSDTNRIVIEAWIKFAILPGVYAGESGIKGSYGAIPKSVLAERVHNIERMIMNNGGIAIGASTCHIDSKPQPPAQPQQPPVYSQPPAQPQQPPVCSQPPAQPQQSQQPQQPQQPQQTQQPQHIFCTQCGNKLPASANFCNVCGNKLK